MATTTTTAMTTAAPRTPAPARLCLLGGFRLITDGTHVTLPLDAQRVLAYLALVPPGQPAQPRAHVAERLWITASAARSYASLRTALWRIRRAGRDIVRASRETVQLDERVEVDVRRAAQAGRLAGTHAMTPSDEDIVTLRGDLLPGWPDDWLLLERERNRQVQLHALEAISRHLCRLGRYPEAVDAAYAAIAGEPLRESAHGALIEVHLAQGNVVLARQELDRYANLLWTELAVRPSAALVDLVTAAVARPTR